MNAWLSHVWRSVLLLWAVGAVGCADDFNPSAADGSHGPGTNQEEERPALTIDEEFARIAQQVPGFGGYYYDESGALNVVLTQPSHQLDAVRVLLSAHRLRGSDTLRIQQGQYDFGDLSRWRDRLDAERMPSLVFTDVDEVRNRVAVGVSGAGREQLVATLARLLIPAEAVIIEDAEPPQEHQASYTYLNKKNRPIAGGLQLQRYSNGYYYYCTLGFNVRRNGKLGFFTNSHCANLNTIHSQGGERIGVTTEDPPFWSNASVVYNGSTYTCSGNDVCRFSDAAYSEYDNGIQSMAKLGYIYRTKEENAYKGGEPTGIGPLEIDDARPFFRIVGKAYQVAVGERIHKMGQRTGWTSGRVTATCRTSTNRQHPAVLPDEWRGRGVHGRQRLACLPPGARVGLGCGTGRHLLGHAHESDRRH